VIVGCFFLLLIQPLAELSASHYFLFFSFS